eukprot:3940541-Rhodomonas_salina.5
MRVLDMRSLICDASTSHGVGTRPRRGSHLACTASRRAATPSSSPRCRSPALRRPSSGPRSA